VTKSHVMANNPIIMYKLRLLVQLHFQGASSRKAADLSRVSRTTVRSYWSKIKSFPL